MPRGLKVVVPLLSLMPLLLAGPTSAFPIAPLGTEGLKVLVSGADPVIATYQGNSATYSNDLYLMLDASGNPGDDGDFSNDLFIFNNHGSTVGSSVNLGTFAMGTELIFRLFVHNTGYNYYTGPGARNPDGKPHARVQGDWQPNESLVSFEDLYGTPEYPGGYNDLSFSFTNTAPPPMAEPATLALIGAGLLGLAAHRRRRKY